jgi:hypothetical protein
MHRRFFILGVAPDWARSAYLKVGKKVLRVPIHGNTYAYSARSPIAVKDLAR